MASTCWSPSIVGTLFSAAAAKQPTLHCDDVVDSVAMSTSTTSNHVCRLLNSCGIVGHITTRRDRSIVHHGYMVSCLVAPSGWRRTADLSTVPRVSRRRLALRLTAHRRGVPKRSRHQRIPRSRTQGCARWPRWPASIARAHQNRGSSSTSSAQTSLYLCFLANQPYGRTRRSSGQAPRYPTP